MTITRGMARKCLTRMVKKHKSPIETTVEMSAEYVSDTGKISQLESLLQRAEEWARREYRKVSEKNGDHNAANATGPNSPDVLRNF